MIKETRSYKRYHLAQSRGICTQCRKVAVKEGKHACEECLKKDAKLKAKLYGEDYERVSKINKKSYCHNREQRLKEKREYYLKNKIRISEYKKKYELDHKEEIREKQKIRNKIRSRIAKDNNLCGKCRKHQATPNHSMCEKCRETSRVYDLLRGKKRRENAIKENLCSRCKLKPKAKGNFCASCLMSSKKGRVKAYSKAKENKLCISCLWRPRAPSSSFCVHCNKRNNEWAKRKRRVDPVFRLSSNIRLSIHHSLKNGKQGKHWESLVGFSLSELKIHLEKQFKKGMTWDNYGKYWEIDHRTPISWFKFENYTDEGFKKAWALENLQPLQAKINNAKRNNYSEPTLKVWAEAGL